MLVLTRKAKEEICIGNDITVTIVRVKGQSVRIGINAPEHVNVMRSELITPDDRGPDDRGPDDRGTDDRGRGHQRCGESASPDGGSVDGGSADDGSSRRQSRDSQSDSPSDMVAADTVDADRVAGAESGRSTTRNVDVASRQSKAIRANECGCQAGHLPIGSTTAFARVVARRRQNRTNQLFPSR